MGDLLGVPQQRTLGDFTRRHLGRYLAQVWYCAMCGTLRPEWTVPKPPPSPCCPPFEMRFVDDAEPFGGVVVCSVWWEVECDENGDPVKTERDAE